MSENACSGFHWIYTGYQMRLRKVSLKAQGTDDIRQRSTLGYEGEDSTWGLKNQDMEAGMGAATTSPLTLSFPAAIIFTSTTTLRLTMDFASPVISSSRSIGVGRR